MKINKDKRKDGILLVHFGTSKLIARQNSLDTINQKVKDEFCNFTVEEAYTSRMVIKKVLKEEGIRKLTPTEALLNMKKNDFTHIIVQGTHIINGIERDHLKNEIEALKDHFQEIKVGDALLTKTEDYEKVADIFHNDYLGKDVVLVGHGTSHHASSAYGMLQYSLQRKKYNNVFVGTVEGYPCLNTVLDNLKEHNSKEVTLVPLMVVAGVHAEEDIAEEWKDEFQDKGIKTHVSMVGMGERTSIQNLIVEHIKETIEFEFEDMKLKKDNILKGVK